MQQDEESPLFHFDLIYSTNFKLLL